MSALDRRAFLRYTATGLALVGSGLAGCAADSSGQTATLIASTAPIPGRFTVPLPIPAVLQPVRDGNIDRYALTARPATATILPGTPTSILSYGGTFPGPTIHATRGRPVELTLTNDLPVPTVVHLHGGHTPPDSDGYPTDLVLPTGGWPHQGHHAMVGDQSAGNRTYRYPMDQRAATLWYHDHRMDFTGPQVWRGLFGMFLVSDDEDAALPLPRGERDIPLAIADRSFDADNQFRYPGLDLTLRTVPGVTDAFAAGVLGDVITVNGAAWPELEVDAARYRLRILNASNARRYEFALDPGGDLIQIGSDGGLLAAPVRRTSITAAPAERFDVIIDFAAYPLGSLVTLLNRLGDGATAEVMRFRVTRTATDDTSIPEALSTIEALVAPQEYREWRFRSGPIGRHAGWLINDLPFDPTRIDGRPVLGRVERWRLYSDLHHPIHIHLSPFQVLSRNGGGIGDGDRGWKDTIDLRPTEFADIAIRFDDHAGKYLLHCHNLEHEDMSMMAAFETMPA